MHKFCIAENGDTSLAVSRGIIISIVPGILMTVNSNSFSGLEVVIKGHNIFLAAHSYGLPIGTSAYINALSFKDHCLVVLISQMGMYLQVK